MENNKKIVFDRLAYVIYEHPNLDRFKSFATDFGLADAGEADGLNFFRGYGRDQYIYVAAPAPPGSGKKFLGAGFIAHSEEDFRFACQMPGAKLLDACRHPGGGRLVQVRDPNNNIVQIIWGQDDRDVPPHGISSCEGGQPLINGALDKVRKGQFTRVRSGPAMIHKLGHFGYITDNYDETRRWYESNFNFVPTDILHSPGDKKLEVAAFLRVNRGKHFVDHHSFLLVRNETTGTKVHHSSFEVEDFDTQMMGHQWLRDRDWDLVWGVGRHVHGSQIFDYWYDSSGFIVEHYADGDLVNEDTKLTRTAAGTMAVWGPPVPAIWSGKASS